MNGAAGTSGANWEAELNAAAMMLLLGAGDDAERLHALRTRLAPLLHDTTHAPWAVAALRSAVTVIDEALSGTRPGDEAQQQIAEILESVMSGVEPATPASRSAAAGGGSPELLADFLAESTDYLAQAEAALLELEADATAAEPVNVVFRAFHTIKSSAAFLGLEPLSALAHDAESLLCPVRDGQVAFGRAYADLLLSAADIMRDLLERARNSDDPSAFREVPAGYAPLREQLAAAVRNGPGDAAVPCAPPPALPVAAVASESPDAPAAQREHGNHAVPSGDGWARVRTMRLDQLVDLVGELSIAHSMVAQDAKVTGERYGELARKVLRTAKIVRQLQDLSITLRMVPLRPLFQRLHRQVRDIAHQAGKHIELVTDGEETEIDRTMVDVLTDPLVHMIRNAVDHAIESAAERIAAGKPEHGTLRLSAHHAGGAVIVELEDDGRGLDRARILRKAIERGVVSAGQELTPAEIDALIFAPGLSTASSITELSGRGVGMDVVRRNIETLRGHIDIQSTPGQGTKFTIRVPLTLAVTDGMLVRAGEERYIVPTFTIVTTFRPTASSLVTEARGGELVMLHGHSIPIVRLHHVFGIRGALTDPTNALLVVMSEGQERYALLVDELIGQQQFVAKPLADGLGNVPGVAGSAVLGDGHVGLIIDPASLLAGARTMAPFLGRAALVGV